MLSYYRKDDKGATEQKKLGIYVVRTANSRKKGQERLAEKAWDLSDSSDSGNE